MFLVADLVLDAPGVIRQAGGALPESSSRNTVSKSDQLEKDGCENAVARETGARDDACAHLMD